MFNVLIVFYIRVLNYSTQTEIANIGHTDNTVVTTLCLLTSVLSTPQVRLAFLGKGTQPLPAKLAHFDWFSEGESRDNWGRWSATQEMWGLGKGDHERDSHGVGGGWKGVEDLQ